MTATALALGRAVAVLLAMQAAAAPAAGQSPGAADVRAEPVRTAKERLGTKASDEQRVDNCKVPPALRGPKPRPVACRDGADNRKETNAKGLGY